MRKILRFVSPVFVAMTLALAACGGKPAEEKKEGADQTPPPQPKPAVNVEEMVFIPAGECMIGGSADLPVTKFSSPVHKVALKAFFIDKYEVTFKQFLNFVMNSGYKSESLKTDKNFMTFYRSRNNPNEPVIGVTLFDAEEYAKWSKKRLPTQEEWEKAASWDESTKKASRYPWGDEWKDGVCNTAEAGKGNLAEVGTFEGDVSYYGVRDMLGNVFEWTSSNYDPYPGSKFRDVNFGKKHFVVKGSAYSLEGKPWSLATRASYPPNVLYGQGFRCVRPATPEEEAAEMAKLKK